jgi:hypothetical protein
MSAQCVVVELMAPVWMPVLIVETSFGVATISVSLCTQLNEQLISINKADFEHIHIL